MYFLRNFGFLITALLLLTQCSSSDENVFTQQGVTAWVTGGKIVIGNNYGKPISYFAVEYETAQLIDWAAQSSPENTIADGVSKTIPWEEIMSDGSLQQDDQVIIYWWQAQDSTLAPANTFQNIVVL